ncbi:MAG: ARMT1-like domain-containing protein [candidate division WOR-3 bacterium]|nr:ARMT1-like domain-containing protein [candidate division WOR-3 bacterium]MCX7756832.1 ARMT1-like domain-containing protein [candidate division WOR-3 bacterium]MDW7987519.1 ARMT1-like domain-containing protein [candidate division WOR-3 bacterium]
MHSSAQCIPCVLAQVKRILAHIPEITEEEKKLAHKVALEVSAQTPLEYPPSKYTSIVLEAVYEKLGNIDPFVLVKRKENELGERLYNELKPKISRLQDPIFSAIKASACGNIIDVGPGDIYLDTSKKDLKKEFAELFERPWAIDHYQIFKEKFKTAEQVLYILDNAGELFLDKLVLETLKNKKLTIVVKAYPILNDALKEDARRAGLDDLGEIIELNRDTNRRYLGVDFEAVTEEFLAHFEDADLVIAKGHANFESLVNTERDVFFVLMAKCPVVAGYLNVKVGDSVFYYSPIKEE